MGKIGRLLREDFIYIVLSSKRSQDLSTYDVTSMVTYVNEKGIGRFGSWGAWVRLRGCIFVVEEVTFISVHRHLNEFSHSRYNLYHPQHSGWKPGGYASQ